MAWRVRLKRGVRAALNILGVDIPSGQSQGHFFSADDLSWISETYFNDGHGPGTPWDGLRDSHMRLPDWFRHGLDPLGKEYADQQHRLWQLISGVERPYEPDFDEKEHDWGDIDPVRTPGYFVRRDPDALPAASDHVLSTGMFLKHSGLKPGDWALEYGAGFGQTALAFARLGVNVDTVDISTTFCEFVRRQAEFFQVPLSAFHGHFGMNPRPSQKYHLIWFYESFHHCLDFQQVVLRLREHLAEGGRVMLGGEPIVEREYSAVPYPWGVRLHSEVVAVVRKWHWFELGFSEDFLFELFTAAGFVGRRIDCEPSLWGRLYVFERRADEVHLGRTWLPTVLAGEWHPPEADGRWTTATSRLPVDTSGNFAAIEVDIANPFHRRRHVEIAYGGTRQRISLGSGQRAMARFDMATGAGELILRSSVRGIAGLTARLGRGRAAPRGVFVRRLRYVQAYPGPT